MLRETLLIMTLAVHNNMKTGVTFISIILLFAFALYFIGNSLKSNPSPIATVYLENSGQHFVRVNGIIINDVPQGWYILTNYEIDKNKCLNFIDGMGKSIHYCGSYSITPWDYYQQRFQLVDPKPVTVWDMQK